MDELDVRWDYEFQGVELPGGIRYLPDFYLEHLSHEGGKGCWLEIKGPKHGRSERFHLTSDNPKLSEPEIDKCRLLARESRLDVYAMSSLYPYKMSFDANDHCTFQGSNWRFGADGTLSDGGYSFGMQDGQLGIWHMPHPVDQRVEKAFEAARGARFEFGQSGA